MRLHIDLRIIITIIVIAVLAAISSPLASAAQQKTCMSKILFYEYGTSKCPHCSAMHVFLEKNYPGSHYFCDIATNRICVKYFVHYLNATGLPGLVPQVIVVKNASYVVAIVIGEIENKTFFDSLSRLEPSTRIPIYEGGSLVGYIVLNTMSDHKRLIRLLYLPGCTCLECQTQPTESVNETGSPTNHVALIQAFYDGFNPCVIIVYVMLLTSLSRKKRFLLGLYFIAGIITGYSILGLVFSYGMHLHFPREIVAPLVAGFGLLVVLSTFREETYSAVGRLEPRPAYGFPVGLLVSLTLLPCSMRPYTMYLASIRGTGASIILRILIYNSIFIVPLLSVLAIFTLVDMRKYRRWVYLVAGMLLMFFAAICFIS